jgi:hypothetical protein
MPQAWSLSSPRSGFIGLRSVFHNLLQKHHLRCSLVLVKAPHLGWNCADLSQFDPKQQHTF